MRALLADAGLDESALLCPPDYPLGDAARVAWIRARRDPAPVAMNCSGKHAAMLATCVARGWSVSGYLGVDHPLQRACRVEIEDRAREKVAAVAVDGCGAPVFALTLTGLARAVSSCVLAEPGSAPRRVADAMRARPELVAGTGRDVTGAHVGCAGPAGQGRRRRRVRRGAARRPGAGAQTAPTGRALRPWWPRCAGSASARTDKAAAAVLQRWATAPVLGGGHPVGEVRAVSGLLG